MPGLSAGNSRRMFQYVSYLTAALAVLCFIGFGCRSGGGGGGGGDPAPEETTPLVEDIIFSSSLNQGIIYETPKSRLSDALAINGYGVPQFTSAVPGAPPVDYSIVIGESEDDYIREVFMDNNLTHPNLPVDGYHITAVNQTGDEDEITFVVVSGKGPRGVVYGIYEMIRQLNLNTTNLWETASVTHAPSFSVRYTSAYAPPNEPPVETNLMHPDEILRMGYNGIILYGLTELCTYDDYDARFYDSTYYQPLIDLFGWPDLRETVEAERANLKALLRNAKKYHLEVFFDGDMLVLPTTAFLPTIGIYNDLLHEGVVLEDLDDILICPNKPKVYEIVEATVDEIFKHFPELDGIQIRSGEVYPFKTQIVGSHPLKFPKGPQGENICSHCNTLTDNEKLRRIADEIRWMVVDKHGKRFNQRSWGYYNSWHSVPEDYLDVVSPIPVDSRLTFSLKQTRTDFWRYNSLNPSLGTGPHPQWAEFQCQREYEGKGAFPLYMGRYFAEGGLECIPMGQPVGGVKDLLDKGVIGGWSWARGGGWNGPSIEREEWVEVNDYALGRLLWDPQLDPFELAREWLVLNRAAALAPVPDTVLDQFVEILRESEEAIVKARYIQVYAKKQYVGPSNGWTPCQNWIRDDVINSKVDKMANKLYETSELQLAIEEKTTLLALADKMLERWDVILENTDPNDTFWQELYNTALYGDSWYRVVAHFSLASFHYKRWQYGSAVEDRDSALYHLDRWQAEWLRHTDDISRLPGVASVFKNATEDGMVEHCDQMLADLTAP